MLTKKIMSATVGLALTASVAMLAGCPTPGGNTPTPSDSASSSASSSPSSSASSASPSSSATASSASPSSSATGSASPSTTPSASQSATNSTTPSGQVGTTPDITTRATFNGKVFDPNDVPVDGAKVNAKSIDAGVTWVGEEQTTTNGAYVFRNAPVGARLQITVTKDGWTTRQQTEVLKSNIQGDPTANVVDFDGIDAIQDEPEITVLKVNGKTFTAPGPSGGTAAVAPSLVNLENATTNLSGIDNSNLEVEMQFSEPVDREDVENNFKITSQLFSVKNNTGFVIDENLNGVTWTWASDDKSVIFKTNKAVLAEQTGDEARYQIGFTEAFTDKTDKEARTGGYIRFSPGTKNDFAIFSVKNDTEDPKVTSISAQDGGAANDIIRLNFSESLEVINQGSPALQLANPAQLSNLDQQLFVYETDNGAGENDGTILGYSVGGTTLADFRGVYYIGKVESAEIVTGNNDVDLTPLGPVSATKNTTNVNPAKGNGILKNARIDKNVVTLEFTPDAFKRDDRIIVSVGRPINADFTDNNNNIHGNLDLDPDGASASNQIHDPAGRGMASGNSTTSANIDVNDAQRVSTAS